MAGWKVRNRDGEMDEYAEAEDFHLSSDGELYVRDGEGEIVAVYPRGEWTLARQG